MNKQVSGKDFLEPKKKIKQKKYNSKGNRNNHTTVHVITLAVSGGSA